MKNLYNFQKDKFSFSCIIKNYDSSHPDGEMFIFEVKLNNDLFAKSIKWYKKSYNHMHLGYIGFERKYRNQGMLKKYIHPRCVEYLKSKGINFITLKPLVTAFIVWILLGFKVENKLEELKIKETIKEYLLDQEISIEDDFGKMQLEEIVKKYKKFLKNNGFPPKLEKVYFTNLKKVLK